MLNKARRHRCYGETRLLPTNPPIQFVLKEGVPVGFLRLCKDCYAEQMKFRKAVNKQLAISEQFPTPLWEELEVYR